MRVLPVPVAITRRNRRRFLSMPSMTDWMAWSWKPRPAMAVSISSSWRGFLYFRMKRRHARSCRVDYRMLLRSGPLTKRFGDELVEQVILGQRPENARK